ncbi:RagB/SusD family nutrient uptake outer membrane protein [Dyadobacter psychrotolerans]|uniref:RagB/SusD family nutrient uptake outer membrane protein n=1 Tax=Dyadobacter psychrotolerans TaxID=2541721 RepID=A0A4R5DWZ8_9BACT|nr:RagB/SusD family nutrient uptake outer membrane protein [Dyadobacter psychrotolerans]TDE17164.1 RagB/SusD family nutrient uptake outer membrane protein [Dyadobacter psychrotolerans]
MKKIIVLLTVVLLLWNNTSCQQDFLNKQPQDQFSDDAVWNDAALIQTFINNTYRGLGHGFNNVMFSTYSDESMAVWGPVVNVTKGLINSSDINDWAYDRAAYYVWDNVYKNIRACNLFFSKIETATTLDDATKKMYMGEEHFVRAYLYHNLVSVYGGVPIITQAYALNEDYAVPRNTYEECIKFIADECDKAAALLPLTQSAGNLGRATKGAALALKARTLLYAASDLYANPTWAAGYANTELIGYKGGERTARWKAAKDAAKAVMDLGVYSLNAPNPATIADASKNRADMFVSKQSSEDIHVRFFLAKLDNDGAWPGRSNGPNGYHNWGGNTPLGQLVDDYEMKDGTKFSWTNPAHAADPYVGRDSRLYADILFEGAQWRQRPADVIDKDPKGIIQVGYWEKWNAATSKMEVVAGLDTRKGPIEDWNGTYSGYYLKKFMDPAVDAQFFRSEVPWRFIRYTEILLNYAEACINLGEDVEAKKYLNMIRKRAAMPDITETGAALMKRYQNERRVEMAYEEQRFFDVRRWMIAPQVYSNGRGVEATYKLKDDKTTSAKPTYKIIEVQQRAWVDRNYFLPIKLDEINKNKKLIQNPGY